MGLSIRRKLFLLIGGIIAAVTLVGQVWVGLSLPSRGRLAMLDAGLRLALGILPLTLSAGPAHRVVETAQVPGSEIVSVAPWADVRGYIPACAARLWPVVFADKTADR